MAMTIAGKEYVTTREAAILLKVTHGRVRQLVQDGIITDKIAIAPRLTMVSLEQVQDYEQNRRKPGRPPNR